MWSRGGFRGGAIRSENSEEAIEGQVCEGQELGDEVRRRLLVGVQELTDASSGDPELRGQPRAAVVRHCEPRLEDVSADNDCWESHPFTRAKRCFTVGKTGCR